MKFIGKLMVILIITLGLLLVIMISGCTGNNNSPVKAFCEKNGWNYSQDDNTTCWRMRIGYSSDVYKRGIVLINGTFQWDDTG